MGKKKRGHYCKGCGAFLPNEKFSGKGHRQHLCKDCKREGRKISSESTADYDGKLHFLSKAIKNCLIVYMEQESFFLFEYQRSRYIISDDFESEIFVYQENKSQKFIVSETLQKNEVLIEVLFNKYDDTMENGHVLDYEDVIYDESIEITKKRKQHLDVILSIHHLMYNFV